MGEHDSSSKNNYSKFDRLSTDTLNDILTQSFLLSDDKVYSIDEIVYIAEIVAKRQKENPDYQGIEAHEAWNIFTKYYFPASSDAKSLYDDSDEETDENEGRKYQIRHRRLARAGAVAAVLAALLIAFTVTAYALGYNPWRFVATWTDEVFGFTNDNPVTAKLQNEMDKQNITDFRAPKYLPEGFEQSEFDSANMEGYYYVVSYYSNNDSDVIIISITQYFDTAGGSTYFKDSYPPEVIVKNGTTYYVFTNAGHNVAVWLNDGIEYGISSNLSKDEVLKIAYSMEA